MNNILQFLYKHIHWIVFIALEIICFVLLFSYNSFQGSVYLSTAGDVAARWLKGKDRVTTYFSLAEQNEALAEQNARLQQYVVELEMLNAQFQLEGLAKTGAVERVHRAGYHIYPAQVIDKSVNKMSNYITLDRGTADGVAPDMGVMGIDGVVGVVYKCTEHYSLVMPLLNDDSYTSCKVLGSNDYGILQWHGGDSRYAMLHDLSLHSDVQLGDTIVTSGNSSFFPEGVMVGTVVDAKPTADGLYKTLKVELSTSFSQLEHVFVVRKMDAAELVELQELLNPKKKKK